MKLLVSSRSSASMSSGVTKLASLSRIAAAPKSVRLTSRRPANLADPLGQYVGHCRKSVRPVRPAADGSRGSADRSCANGNSLSSYRERKCRRVALYCCRYIFRCVCAEIGGSGCRSAFDCLQGFFRHGRSPRLGEILRLRRPEGWAPHILPQPGNTYPNSRANFVYREPFCRGSLAALALALIEHGGILESHQRCVLLDLERSR